MMSVLSSFPILFQRTHIGAFDFGPAFSKTMLYIFPFVAFVVPQPTNEII